MSRLFRGRIGLLALVLYAAPGWAGTPFPCEVVPYDGTSENGAGAEAGVIREFVSVINTPPECQIGGSHFVFGVGVGMTRIASGSPSADIEVLLREPAVSAQGVLPGDEIHPPIPVSLTNIPIFPNTSFHMEMLSRPVVRQDGVALPAARWNGDLFPDIFLSVDESVGTPLVPCFTEAVPVAGDAIAVPLDPCTTGNPNLRAIAQSYVSASHTAFGQFSVGLPAIELTSACSDANPLIVGCRTMNGGVPRLGGTWDLTVLEGTPAAPGPIICQFTNVTLPFDFQCTMTPAQVKLYRGGDTFMEADPGSGAIQSPIVPADQVIFFDGFESGDTFFWSHTVP